MRKFEVALLLAVAVTVVCCAVAPSLTPRWWTAAFEPLCDGILTAEADAGGVVLRSKLWEIVTGVF